jgi:hypothetical protein
LIAVATPEGYQHLRELATPAVAATISVDG